AAVTGDDGPYSWMRAGQGWSVVCSLAFLVASYAAGVQLWGRRLAFCGCLAVWMVPRQVLYASDILSDDLHAAIWMSGFALAVYAWRRQSVAAFAGAGLLAGIAFWVRVEAVLLPAAVVSAMGTALLSQCLLPAGWIAGDRWAPRRWSVALGVFLLAWAVPFGSLVAVAGRLTPRDSGLIVMGVAPTVDERLGPKPGGVEATIAAPPTKEPPVETDAAVAAAALNSLTEDTSPRDEPEPTAAAPAVPPIDAPKLVDRPFVKMEGHELMGFGPTLARLFREVGQETRGWLLALALVGLAARFKPIHTVRGPHLLVVFAMLGCGAMLVLLQMRAGYLAGRYMTPLLPLLGVYAMTGAVAVLAWMERIPRLPWERDWTAERVRFVRRYRTVTLMAAVAVFLCVPSWFKPMHRHRQGHMECAAWLAEHAGPGDLVFDPQFVSGFFAGRPLWSPPGKLPRPLPIRYAVVDPTMVYRTDGRTHRAI
ncbi:MAG: hypothetical protein ACRDD1_14115, partial [Planctomycetia bacterium]